ncbi:MAG: hypothetical protein WB609_11205 [Candidatus Cybelea sp.]
MRSTSSGTFGPLARTMEIAPFPGGVAIAAIVSAEGLLSGDG